jgi:hypothetical protein
MEGLYVNRILNADDFSLFYHLEQISGSLFLSGIPETSQIIIPNLRIIRGLELEMNNSSILLKNLSVNEIVLPKLTEISRGNVLIEHPSDNPLYNSTFCSWAQVNWLDIIDDGEITIVTGGMMNSFKNCGTEREALLNINTIALIHTCPSNRTYKLFPMQWNTQVLLGIRRSILSDM